MKIRDSINILNAQIWLMRTIIGRPISEYGLNTVLATLEDKNNQDAEVTQCKNCGLIASSLLYESGCKNCGCHDINQEVKNIV